MYLITIYNDGVPTIIHGERHKLSNAKITRERNQICSLSFDIYPNNPGYDLMRPLATTVQVIDTRYGTLAFEGRVITPVPSMDESGMIMRSVTCEHVEAYLLDSMQAYVEERQWESPAEFISYVLDVHNARMPEEKRVYLGTVDFQTYDTSDGLFCGIQREKTWNTLRTKLTDTFGGEMRVRRAGGLLYLDYAEKLGETRATPIKLGRNMRSSRREVNPNEVITRLYPYGCKLTVIETETETDEDGNETVVSETEVETEERLTIATVNDGCDYIEDAVAIGEYGIIEGVHEWDDVTQPNILLTKARAWLGENNKMPVTTTLTALDLSLLGIDPDDFELLDWYPCENPLIGLDDTLEIVKQTVDVCSPMDSTFDMGQTAQTTSKQMASISAVGKVVESVKSQQQTAITNLQNSVKATKASIDVMEDRVVTSVTKTVTTTVKNEVESQIADLDLKDGEDGVGVESVVEQYYVSASATALEGGTWLDAYPSGSSGYVWTRTVVTYTDGSMVELDPVCVTGPQGPQGEPGKDGKDGEDGADGRSAYELAVAGGFEGTEAEWLASLVGKDGADGEEGKAGADGKTPYFHVAYGTSLAGANFSTVYFDSATHMGTCTDYNSADPTTAASYTWALIKGADGQDGQDGSDGVSVTSTTRYYQLAASKPSVPTANPPSGWSTTEPTYTAGSTDSLFFVDLTTFSNSTWSYSEVSQSSSYDAAKIAYDSAIAAGQDASAAQKAADAAAAELDKKADDYSILLYNSTSGNPKPVKFATVNYSTCGSENGVSAKISMVSGHGNGTSYAFLQDAIIRVNYVGGVEVDNVKHYGAATPTYDGAERQYGDIFWVIDTTNKIVDFYCLMGQYSRVYQTPWKRLTYSTGGTVTQYTSCTVYSSGTKVWANNSDIALASDLASLVANVDVEYCLSDSDETAPTDGWVSSPPTIPEGQYLWSRSLVTYTDGTTAYTTPYCVSKAMAESVTVGGRNILLGSSKYTEDSPYVLTPQSSDHYVYMGDALAADVVEGETYTLQCETDGLWGSHNTSGNRSQECTIWLTNASQSFHDCYGGTYGEHTGRRVWTFTAKATESVRIRFNVYGSGNPAVSFWNVAIQKGNAATQWTPPVEEMATQDDVADVVVRLEVTETAVTETLPNAIQDSITTTTTTSREYTDGRVETLRTEREKIIRRDSDGITISDKTDGADEALDMNLDSDHLHFRLNKQPIAGIEAEDDGSGYFFGSDVKVDSTLTLGSFAWTVRHNGNMGLIYIGGEQ